MKNEIHTTKCKANGASKPADTPTENSADEPKPTAEVKPSVPVVTPKAPETGATAESAVQNSTVSDTKKPADKPSTKKKLTHTRKLVQNNNKSVKNVSKAGGILRKLNADSSIPHSTKSDLTGIQNSENSLYNPNKVNFITIINNLLDMLIMCINNAIISIFQMLGLKL